MSSLLKFTNYLKERHYAVEDLEKFVELIQPIEHPDGYRGYKVKPLQQADRITQRCKVLIQYTWHCRDYVKKILIDHGIPDPGNIVNTYIENSRDIQVISFLANEAKHAGTDHTQRWAVDLSPRFGKPFARGVLETFPHTLKPTFQVWGESIPEFEFVGSAGVGKLAYQFTDFVWTFSCIIEDKHGQSLGHASAMCENTFQAWLKILGDNHIET